MTQPSCRAEVGAEETLLPLLQLGFRQHLRWPAAVTEAAKQLPGSCRPWQQLRDSVGGWLLHQAEVDQLLRLQQEAVPQQLGWVKLLPLPSLDGVVHRGLGDTGAPLVGFEGFQLPPLQQQLVGRLPQLLLGFVESVAPGQLPGGWAAGGHQAGAAAVVACPLLGLKK